jgi:hypothetical protein
MDLLKVEDDNEQEEEDEEDGDDGDGEEEEQAFPPAIKNRVLLLESLHESATAVDAELRKERIAIEQKRNALRAPIYQKRAKVISGEVEAEANGLTIYPYNCY